MNKFLGILLFSISVLSVLSATTDSEDCKNIENFFLNYFYNKAGALPKCCDSEQSSNHYIKCDKDGSITDIDLRLSRHDVVIDFSNFPILPNLKSITIEGAKFIDNSLPTRLFESPNLKSMGIYQSNVTKIIGVGDNCSLEELKLYNNDFVNFPNHVIDCPKLWKLDLSLNEKLVSIPENIDRLTNLKNFYLGQSGLTEIPNSIYRLKLKDFDINNTPGLSTFEIHKFSEPVDICDFRGEKKLKCYEPGACKKFVTKEYIDHRDTEPENLSLYSKCDDASNETIRKISSGEKSYTSTIILILIVVLIILFLVFCYFRSNRQHKEYIEGLSKEFEHASNYDDVQPTIYNKNSLKSPGSISSSKLPLTSEIHYENNSLSQPVNSNAREVVTNDQNSILQMNNDVSSSQSANAAVVPVKENNQETQETHSSPVIEKESSITPSPAVKSVSSVTPASPLSVASRVTPASPLSVASKVTPSSPLSVASRLTPTSPTNSASIATPASPLTLATPVSPVLQRTPVSPTSNPANMSFNSTQNVSFSSNNNSSVNNSYIRSNSIHNTVPMKNTKLSSKQLEALKCEKEAESKDELPPYNSYNITYNQMLLQYQMNQLQNQMQNQPMNGMNGITFNQNNMPLYYNNIPNSNGMLNMQNSFIQPLPNAYIAGNMINYGNGVVGSTYMNNMNNGLMNNTLVTPPPYTSLSTSLPTSTVVSSSETVQNNANVLLNNNVATDENNSTNNNTTNDNVDK